MCTHGCDVSARDCDGLTALELAEAEGHTEVAAKLQQLINAMEKKRRKEEQRQRSTQQ